MGGKCFQRHLTTNLTPSRPAHIAAWAFLAEDSISPLAAHNRMPSAAICPAGPPRMATLSDAKMGGHSRLWLSYRCSGDFAECVSSLACPFRLNSASSA